MSGKAATGRGRSAMRSHMALGDFLVAYLNRAGVTHIFGLPGDLVLGLFQRFGRDRGLEIVTLSHEPSVGFAADGYARSTRRLGVVCVTYGAGGNNIVNPVAGAYAEQVPLLVVSGGPGEAELKVSGVHHQVKDVETQFRVLSEVTCASRILRHPELAATDVHAVVKAILTESRPGYLEIHRDMVDLQIHVPEEIQEWDGSFSPPRSDRRKLAEAVADTEARLAEAKRPVLIGGVELYREGAERAFRKLAEKIQAPVATSVLAKGVFPMDHPLHLGIHIGPFSAKPIQDRVRSADLVLALGNQLTDMNLGAARPQVSPESSVWAVDGRVNVSFHQYGEVHLKDFVSALTKRPLPSFGAKVRYHDNLKERETSGRSLSVNDLLVELNRFLAAQPGYDVVSESGDMLFGGLELRVPKGLYFAQGYYASMGFGVPAAMGAQIGTGRRPIVLSGDGAFQMTGMEISHAPKHGLSPIVVVVNNGGWGIFRPVTPKKELLEIPNWPYAEMARGWGGEGFVCETSQELHDALHAAHRLKGFALIECRVPHDDLSPISRRYIKASARKGSG